VHLILLLIPFLKILAHTRLGIIKRTIFDDVFVRLRKEISKGMKFNLNIKELNDLVMF